MGLPGWQAAGTCRICGEPGLEGAEFGAACARCGGSPLCDRCGHARRVHAGVFGGGPARCKGTEYDFEALAAEACPCPGYEPRTRDFAAAAFTEPAARDDDLPPLRLA